MADIKEREKSVEQIPEWAMCYLINGDKDNLTDEEINEINNWKEEAEIDEVCLPSCYAEAYFCKLPAFGKPANVYDCVCFLKSN